MWNRWTAWCVILLAVHGCALGWEDYNMRLKLRHLASDYAPDRRTERFDIAWQHKDDVYVLTGATTSLDAKEAFLQYLEDAELPYQDNIVVYPDSTVTGWSVAIVQVSVANIRSEPRHASELATQELLGTELRLLSKRSGWYLVQTPNCYLGWVDGSSVVTMRDDRYLSYQAYNRAMVSSALDHVYAQPSDTSPILTELVMGSILCVIDEAGWGMHRILLPDSSVGYTPAKLLFDLPAGNGHDIEHTALSMMGIPYLWGGTSIKGLDCSGYTKLVYMMNGYLLPRDASQQALVGIEVTRDKSWSELEKGDLLFFGTTKPDGSDKVTHVGIYIGNGRMIHASGRVMIQSLVPDTKDFAADRYNTFLSARRMLTDTIPLDGIEPIWLD